MITLGQASNYSAGQVWRHLFAWGTKRNFEQLRTGLAQRYRVSAKQVLLYHTGRSALTAAIQSVAPAAGCQVIIPGLTCIAVVRAVRAAGCKPVFVDITAQNLEYNYDQLEKTLKTIDKTGDVCYNKSIILVQNTLGITWNVLKIEEIATKYGAEIVEDLAHSAGRLYADGREAGTMGAAVALSFGKGKAIDTISGGAAILRHPASAALADASQGDSSSAGAPSLTQPTRRPKLSDRLRDRWYPVFGAISRAFGKVGCKMMGVLVKLHFVQRSADAELDLTHRLTYWQAKLAYRQLQQLPETPLREFQLINDRSKALAELSRHGYNFDEIWYDTPVSPGRYYQEADFPEAECPETVQISQQIINFPTWYRQEQLAEAHAIIDKHRDSQEITTKTTPATESEAK